MPVAKDILVPISPGELIDKITILQLKEQHIGDEAKLANVRHELAALSEVLREGVAASSEVTELSRKLLEVNSALWVIEDDIRICERQGDFGDRFIALARSVYVQNDERARLKKEINTVLGSSIVEEKSYA